MIVTNDQSTGIKKSWFIFTLPLCGRIRQYFLEKIKRGGIIAFANENFGNFIIIVFSSGQGINVFPL